MSSGLKRKSKHVISSGDESEKDETNRYYDEEGGFRVGDIYIPPPPTAICSMDTNAPRLVIERIENRNFKSYADTQFLGPFDKCFTSIIGPNGSGKSNVIDSMLFVFGYRGSKIRSKKISSLIHSSEERGKIQSCTVSVYFKLIIDKGDDYDEVPNSRFVVSRTGCKDNSSIYEIDGRRVAFKEVAILLKKYGIDLDHNRFLILQGEVEQIAMMKPKGQNENDTGMLEYLEDIIGTSRFKEPLEKLNVVVGELTEDRHAKVQKVELIGKEKNDMQGAYEAAIQFLKTENYITELRNIEYQKYIYDTELAKKQKEEKESELQKDLDEMIQTMKEINKKRAEMEKSLKEQEMKKEKLEEKLQSLNEIYKKIEDKDNVAMAEMVQVNGRRKKDKDKLAADKKKLMDIEKIPENSLSDMEEIKKKIISLEKEEVKLKAEKEEATIEHNQQTKPLKDKRESLQSKLVELQKSTTKSKTELNLAETDLKVFLKDGEDRKHALVKLRETYESAKQDYDSKEKVIKELQEKIPRVEQELQTYAAKLPQVRTNHQELADQVSKLRAKVSDSRSSMQQRRSRGRVLDYIMGLKEQGKLTGIFGRLGDLGAIESKYDVAISSSCGPLDHIVVNNIETAQKCINYLKANNIGRGYFLALDKQEHFRKYLNNRVKTPENTVRLFDKITVKDERLKTAFYYGIRETLVATDLEQATRIAYGPVRHRVVTLKGEVIELVGTMTGGGNTVIRGRMGTKVLIDTSMSDDVDTPEKIENLERQLTEITAQAEQLHIQKINLEETVEKLSTNLRSMKTTLQNYLSDYESLVDMLPHLQKQFEDQEELINNTEVNKAQVKKLESIIKTKKAMFEKTSAMTLKIQTEVDDITKQMTLINGGKLMRIQNNLTDVTKNINKLKAELVSINASVTNSKRNVTKCKERIAIYENNIKKDNERLTQLQEERNEIEVDAKTLIESIEEVKTQINIANTEETIDYKTEISEMGSEEAKLKERKIALEHSLTTIKTTIKEFVANLSHWKKAITKLSLHDIPENEVEIERLESTINSTSTRISNRSDLSASNQKKQLRKLTEDELINCNVVDIQYTMTLQQDKLTKKPNLNVIDEYKKVELEYCKRVREVEEVTKRRKLFRDTLEKVKKTRETEFLNGYQIINLKLKEMYQMITLGGDAELELVDSLDPFNDGVSFTVRPPKKSWKNICNLSGGEKTLSSLALVFALHYYKPSPLYVMDEIDAALDFKNVSIVGNYIKERTKNAQFIIISLRSNMFELADRLVGIYKTHNCTKSCSVNPQKLNELLSKALAALNITAPTHQQLTQVISHILSHNHEHIENEPESQIVTTIDQNVLIQKQNNQELVLTQ